MMKTQSTLVVTMVNANLNGVTITRISAWASNVLQRTKYCMEVQAIEEKRDITHHNVSRSGCEKPSKRARSQCFKVAYTKQWPCMIAADDDEFVLCTVCDDSFSTSHGGRSDIR